MDTSTTDPPATSSHPPLTNQPSGPSTPTYLPTPILSSASPDTPGKADTPYLDIIQTPASAQKKVKGRIGVGVKMDPEADDEMEGDAGGTVGMMKNPNEVMDDKEGDTLRGLGIDELDMVESGKEGDKEMAETVGKSAGPSQGSGPSRSSSSPSDVAMPSNPPNTKDFQEFPDVSELRRMEKRLEEMSSVANGEGAAQQNVDELVKMARSLLTPALGQLPFLRDQVETQRATIATMQEQARLSARITGIERERHAAERASWHAQTRALLHVRDSEVAAGTRSRKVLDLDVGYHNELEASNKRLEMDNRLMAPRLADTQRQIDKLVTELRHLRTSVLLNTGTLVAGTSHHPPQMPPAALERRASRSPMKTALPSTTMGDARAEHLLLAAKKVRAMRAQDPTTGLITLDELHRHGVVGPAGGVGYSEGYGGMSESSEEEEVSEEEEEDLKPMLPPSNGRASISKGKGKGSLQNTPLLPRAKRISKRNLPGPTTPRSARKSVNGPPATTPGGSNFSDLLRAAEMADRPSTPPRDSNQPAHIPMSAMSATRSTTRTRAESVSDRGSPVKKARHLPPDEHSATWERVRRASDGERTRLPPIASPASRAPAGADDAHEASALDLLAQASQLDVAQGPQEAEPPLGSATRFEGMMDDQEKAPSSPRSSTGGALAPPLELRSTDLPRPLVDDSNTEATASDRRPSFVHPPLISTPLNRPRQLSMSNVSEIATPARGFGAYPPESPFDDTPGGAGSADLVSGAFASPTGATVPGLGKYVHLTSSMPARRVRSPYLKWTVEEDELLARAVAMHGEKWDLVSKGVPTRSYHQVRQRWLRKTGAFDKKQLAGGAGEALESGLGMGLEVMADEREGSPTPQSGKAKKRKQVGMS